MPNTFYLSGVACEFANEHRVTPKEPIVVVVSRKSYVVDSHYLAVQDRFREIRICIYRMCASDTQCVYLHTNLLVLTPSRSTSLCQLNCLGVERSLNTLLSSCRQEGKDKMMIVCVFCEPLKKVLITHSNQNINSVPPPKTIQSHC